MHATGTDQVDGHFGLVGTFTADGVSAVTSGTLDVNDAHPTQQHQDQAMQRLEEFNAAKQIAEFEKKDADSLQ